MGIRSIDLLVLVGSRELLSAWVNVLQSFETDSSLMSYVFSTTTLPIL